MNKPLPAIYAPTLAARRKVYHAIYAQGWMIGDLETLGDVLHIRRHDTDASSAATPYIVLKGGRFYHSSRINHHTPMNSPAHLVSYAKTLGERAPTQ